MSRTTPMGRRKALALAPMLLLSTAWWAGGPSSPWEVPQSAPALPDVPFDAPTSVQETRVPTVFGSLSRATDATPAVATTHDIPFRALFAYRRAESLLSAADPSCHLSWSVVAAIGRVESDHGRHGGGALDTNGVATPAIVGVQLDGTNGTARILDTDSGEIDGDPTFDRAVGPMQFIPSTWASVRTDADADGRLDPQDIDDAAAAAGVYLCSGEGDLSTDEGLAKALHTYNQSDAYVDQVMAIAHRYADTDVTVDPGDTTLAITDTTVVAALTVRDGGAAPAKLEAAAATPRNHPAPRPPKQAPVRPITPKPAPAPVEPPAPEPLPEEPVLEPTPDPLTEDEALERCRAELPLGTDAEIATCMDGLGFPAAPPVEEEPVAEVPPETTPAEA